MKRWLSWLLGRPVRDPEHVATRRELNALHRRWERACVRLERELERIHDEIHR